MGVTPLVQVYTVLSHSFAFFLLRVGVGYSESHTPAMEQLASGSDVAQHCLCGDLCVSELWLRPSTQNNHTTTISVTDGCICYVVPAP